MTTMERGEAIANAGPKGTDHHGLHQRMQRLRNTIREPRRWISPWFAAYVLLGAISSGVLPILLPLSLSWVAYVSYTG